MSALKPIEVHASHTLADGRRADVSALWLCEEWSAWLLVVDGVSRIRASLAPEDEAALLAGLERERERAARDERGEAWMEAGISIVNVGQREP